MFFNLRPKIIEKPLVFQCFMPGNIEKQMVLQGFVAENIEKPMVFQGSEAKTIEKTIVFQCSEAKTIEKTMAFNDFQCRIEKHCVFICFFGPEIRISPDERFFQLFNKSFNYDRQLSKSPPIFPDLVKFPKTVPKTQK